MGSVKTVPARHPERAPVGVPGLDAILGGGLPVNRMYLVAGDPGAGKTTLALQFLMEGASRGEVGLYLALSESEMELRDVAASHGWALDSIAICDLAASDESLKADAQYTLFHPSEIELSEMTRTVLDKVEQLKPRRVVFDSLSELRLLARDPLRYRRQILSLKQYFTSHPCTVLLLDYDSTPGGDRQLESLTHGVIQMEQFWPDYGGQRRRLRVQKMRGVPFRDGYHDFNIVTGGVIVYPRLAAGGSHGDFPRGQISSGVPGLDSLLGGGLHRGTSTLVLGPAGVGKSTLTAQYIVSALNAGHRAIIYVFDEVPDTFQVRSEGMGMDIGGYINSGRLQVCQVDPAELSPGEFASRVQTAVEKDGIDVVAIDSLNGYQNAMPEERFLSAHLHQLLAYLNQTGVMTLLVMAQNGILGDSVQSPVDLSYLADTVILLRYFEAAGEVRKAISVVKKRTGPHERYIRELNLSAGGLAVGPELRQFEGVLSGRLLYLGRGAGPQEENGSLDAP